MATYIGCLLEDGTNILLEADGPKTGGVTKASRHRVSNIIALVNQKLKTHSFVSRNRPLFCANNSRNTTIKHKEVFW